MKRLKKFIGLFLPALMLMTLLTGTGVQAALLDVGPTVAEEIGSSGADIKLGYPLWYRDTNRMPLELCMDETMCFYAPNTAGQPDSFPGNVADELFYYAADAAITLPGTNQKAILVQAIEAAYSTGNVVPGAQISFARIRIRVDTPVVGTYVVTTPYKQFTFDVTVAADGVNFTEDIGIGADGVFTGALTGSIGPFLYCVNPPAPFTGPDGGSYIGLNAATCKVAGSTFPSVQSPTNFFRVDGPLGSNLGGPGIDFVETSDFRVQGKLHTGDIPTPLTVDKVTYALDSRGMQVNAFATTQAMSNQKEGGAFPGQYALKNVPSKLRLSGDGIQQQDLTTDSPADGKFFSTSGIFDPSGVIFPATATVTNTEDSPNTEKNVPLVDEVVISSAVYNPSLSSKVLSISATSYDSVNQPALQAFMPGMTAPLGLLSDGQLNVTFPVTDNSVTPSKTYAIPPLNVTVRSAIGGSATVPVITFLPVQPAPAIGVMVAPTVPSPQIPGTTVTFIASGSGGSGDYEYRFWLKTGAVWNVVQDYSTSPSWSWNTAELAAGSYFVQVSVRSVGSTTVPASSVLGYSLVTPAPPASAVTLVSLLPSPQTSGTSVTFVAAGSGGSENYQYRFSLNTGGVWAVVQNYSTNATWTWNTTDLAPGAYPVQVDVINAGTTNAPASKAIAYSLVAPAPPASAVTLASLLPSPQNAGASVTFVAVGSGGSGNYQYRFWLNTGGVWAVVQNYSSIATWTWNTTGLAPGAYPVQVDVINAGTTNAPASKSIAYSLVAPAPPAPASAVTLASLLPSPQNAGASITFVAVGSGGSGNYQYRFWLNTGGVWAVVQNYSSIATWTWNTTGLAPGAYPVQVDVINAGTTNAPASKSIAYSLVAPAPRAQAVTLTSNVPSPQNAGASVTFAAAGSGGSGTYEYRFWLKTQGVWAVVQNYSTNPTWTWNTTGTGTETHPVQVDVRNVGSTLNREAAKTTTFTIL